MKKLNKKATAILFGMFFLLSASFMFSTAVGTPETQQAVDLKIIVTDQQKPGVDAVVDDFVAANDDVNSVEVVASGTRADDQLTYLTTQMGAQSSEFDVIGLDTVWPAQFAENGWIVELTDLLEDGEMDDYVGAMVDSCTYNDSIWAYPYFMNIGSLYYRKDLLDAQGYTSESDFDTWAELKEAANDVLAASDNDDLVGYVGQFDAYEGGTVNMIEWIGSNGVTNIFDNQGRIDLTNPDIEEAISFLKGSIAPRYTGVLDTDYFIAREALVSDEGSSVGKWLAGNAVFMRQWTFGYPSSISASAINDTNADGDYTQFGVMPIPTFDGTAGQKSCGVGGAVLAIPVYSQHQDQALKLIRFLGDEEAQKAELTEVGNFPALETVYSDFSGELAWAQEFLPSFERSVARPVHPKYSQLSQVLSGTFNDIISCQLEVESGLEQMESDAASAIKAQPAPEPIIPGFSVFYLLVSGTAMIAVVMAFLKKRFE